jgi:hypothetical protein
MKKFIIVLAACALVVAFTVPAMAKMEWSFYGSARIHTTVNDVSWEQTNWGAVNVREFDDTDFMLDLQGNSRFGAWARSEDIVGRVELGHSAGAFTTRLLYGIWKLGWGDLFFGQTYTPAASQFLSNQVWGGDIDLLGSGAAYGGRLPQIKLEVPFTNGLFEVGLIRPNAPQRLAVGNVINGNAVAFIDTDTTFPKVEARVAYKIGPAQLRLGGGWNTYEAVGIDVINAENELDVDAWFITGDVQLGFGPFYLNVGGNVGQNPAEYGLLQTSTAFLGGFAATYDATINDIQDVDWWGVVAVAGFKVNDMLSFEAGYGHNAQDIDVAGVSFETDTNTYYINASITPIKGVTIVPEVGYVDLGDMEISNALDVDQGDITYYMVKWQIDF